jgi:predicted phosphodiesterase
MRSKIVNDCLHRRAFLRGGALFLSGGVAASLFGHKAKPLRVGVITDIHYADKAAGGSRHYRDSIAKMQTAVKAFNQHGVDFAIELGDLIDAAKNSVEAEIGYLRTIDAEYAKCQAPRHYVYGNHCLDMLNRKEFAANSGANEQGHYSFDRGMYHFVILDSCYTSAGTPYSRKNFKWTDANIPAAQLEWLAQDLAATKRPSIVFVHQRLDQAGSHMVRNAAQVRGVLEKSAKVLAVFQGHSHKNTHQDINGIHYTTLRGMVEGSGVENNGYSEVLLHSDGSIVVTGFAHQASYAWKKAFPKAKDAEGGQ